MRNRENPRLDSLEELLELVLHLGHLLDALPVIGKALAKRATVSDGGSYNEGGQKVTVRSNVYGGLFVWSQQLEEHPE